ncbi:MAG: hypothetical protein FJW30_27795 [Acidobacteria bacterium]|nr:hypothetical protein [Acidobacteriota bacterium]
MRWLLAAVVAVAQNWPQAAGPNGTWAVQGPAPVDRWSVAAHQNIMWKTPLPNGGQSGIAVWGGRLYLTTFAEGEKTFSSKVVGHAVDAKTGRILWSVPLDGVEPSPMLYAFSDSTTPSPVTDGKRVWFFNASGAMGCWTADGKLVWKRSYRPWGKPFPFNKQHEPMLIDGTILNVEPLDGGAKPGWNYLRAIDAATGKTKWIAEDATTTYNTARAGRGPDGKWAVLHGRGGWHDVPETPVGLSLARARDGKNHWRFVAGDGVTQAPDWQALYVMHFDERYAYWFGFVPEERHLVLDVKTGKPLREQSLIRGVDYRRWEDGAYKLYANVNLRELRTMPTAYPLAAGEVMRVLPSWHTNIVASGYHYFLTTAGHRRLRKGRAGPAYCVGRVAIETGKVEYLELPVAPGVYGRPVKTRTLNAAGVDVAAEERSRTDGYEIAAFFGTPIAVNKRLYFTNMLGVTYVIDSTAKVLDASAILGVNDLGPTGETWSLNSMAYANGVLYHRSARELVAIR